MKIKIGTTFSDQFRYYDICVCPKKLIITIYLYWSPQPMLSKHVTLDDFKLLSVIGKGSYAKVVLVKKNDSDKTYAMKILKKKHIEKKKQEAHIMTERNVLVQVDHPFVIKMYASFQTPEKLFFILQFCPGGELFGLLSKKHKLSEEQTKFYAAQMVLALEYLHARDIIYRDLKPQNVLIDDVGYIRLTDFGLSKMFVQNNDALSICGTPEYLAPEILYKEGHGKPVDWWCLGCIIFEMITGLPPFYSKSRNELFDKIKFSNPNIPAFSSGKLKSLLEGLFQKKVQNRLGSKGAEDIKKHPFFEKTNWDAILKKQIKAPFVPVVKSQVDVSNFDIEFTQCAIESHKEQLQEQCKQYFDFSYEKKSPIENGGKMDVEEPVNEKVEITMDIEQS